MAKRGRPKKNGQVIENGGDESAPMDTRNVGDRESRIVGALSEMYELDAEIKALSEKHIKPLRDQKSGIKKALREDFQITPPVIQARYYSFRIEQDAIATNDGVTLDAICEMFNALPVGGQGELFSDHQPTEARHSA